MESILLNNNIEIPQLGFGVFQITAQEQCRQSVRNALETGYRLFDTAACYGNEGAVGEAIKQSGIDRKEIFLTSKVWIQDAGYERTIVSFEKTLHNLQMEYLDLYLIHMPYGDYYGSWRAMEELYEAGKIRALGVYNFESDRLLDLILNHKVAPSVNQMELHPFCQQKKLRLLMDEYNIKAMAWAPFAEGMEGIFEDKVLRTIGRQYGKTPAQVILRFLRQEGIIAIPKSVHKERIEENYEIDDFRLSVSDMERIYQMDTGNSRILEIRSLEEVKRLHDIRFIQ
ncbi:aldo/keto reductase [Clostridium sp. MCC353]|uniref:aldo/keto reductase n=1 Tax=Clostridium sp. MCC353 TaxID=2592646 RepID=UPI001C0303C9|nr:aldo/keto reductase [Clostridium sp. MCC353]MBT9779654.1 aldo/keto reductase [Clostridium sp. MCC353]